MVQGKRYSVPHVISFDSFGFMVNEKAVDLLKGLGWPAGRKTWQKSCEGVVFHLARRFKVVVDRFPT